MTVELMVVDESIILQVKVQYDGSVHLWRTVSMIGIIAKKG